jgi:hypothetical protein
MRVHDALRALFELAKQLTAAGPTACGALFLCGILLLVVGFRAYRIAVALVAGLVATFAVAHGVAYWHIRPGTSLQMTMEEGAVVAAALSLLWPGLLTVVAFSTTGLLIATQFIQPGQPDENLIITTVGAATGAIVPSILYSSLPSLMVPPVAASLVSLGAWGLYGLEYSKNVLYRVPVAWLLLAGLLTLCGWFIENLRLTKARVEGPMKQGQR